MNVLLIKPYNKLSDHIQPPLGLAYLASAIRDQHGVEILDLMKRPQEDREVAEYVRRGGFQVVGFQCYSQEIAGVKRTAGYLKQHLPGVLVLVGGPHPTVLPEESMAYFGPAVDYLLRGECENTLPRLLERLEAGAKGLEQIAGLVWRDQGRVVINESGEVIADLETIKPPAWDLLQPQTYPPAQHGAFFKRYPIAPIITTRGCPFLCKYCTAPIISGNRIRTRSARQIMEEIRHLHERHGIREIHIVDDNFTMNKEHARQILQGIVDYNRKLSLAFPNGIRIETVDEELLRLMKKSGVYLISVGLESGSDRVLKLMNKRLTVEKIKEKINLIQKAGIAIAGFFILGFPDETKQEMEETIRFSLRLPLLRANYFDFIPLPGTAIYRELREKGEIGEIDWDKTYFISAPYSPRGITKNELRDLQRLAFLRFYLRPHIFIRNILQIKSLRQIKYLARRFYHWFVMKAFS